MAIKIGVMTDLTESPAEKFAQVIEMGLSICQLCNWNMDLWTDEIANKVVEAQKKTGVEISSLWAGYPGPDVWNPSEGPTIGFVPPEYRELRVKTMLRAIDFAVKIGAPSITTHAGFIPEIPSDPLYAGTIDALRRIAVACKENGLGFWFETGQETPVTLWRTMIDIGTDNLGVNFDPANLLIYGKANPIDALDIIGQFVKGVHAKDAEYPTDPNSFGVEKPLGEGRVNFPVFISKLKSIGFDGAIVIEREISGPQQIMDIKRAIEVLTPLV